MPVKRKRPMCTTTHKGRCFAVGYKILERERAGAFKQNKEKKQKKPPLERALGGGCAHKTGLACCARAGTHQRQEPKSPYSHSKEKKARPDFHFHFHFIRSHKPRYRIRANPDKTEILYVRIPDEKQEIQSNFLSPRS